jgi:hypothetical protein
LPQNDERRLEVGRRTAVEDEKEVTKSMGLEKR